jgi:hypothetical protein
MVARPDGRAALRRTFDTAAQFYQQVRPAYPAELPDERAEITQTGLFEDAVARHFDGEIRYTASASPSRTRLVRSRIQLARAAPS